MNLYYLDEKSTEQIECDTPIDPHASFHSAQDDDFLDDFFEEISMFDSHVFSTFEAHADSHDLSIT